MQRLWELYPSGLLPGGLPGLWRATQDDPAVAKRVSGFLQEPGDPALSL